MNKEKLAQKVQDAQAYLNKIDEAINNLENTIPSNHLKLISKVNKVTSSLLSDFKLMKKEHAFLKLKDNELSLYMDLKKMLEDEEDKTLFLSPDGQQMLRKHLFKGYLMLLSNEVYQNIGLDSKIKISELFDKEKDKNLTLQDFFISGYCDYTLRPRFLATHLPELWKFMDTNIFI